MSWVPGGLWPTSKNSAKPSGKHDPCRLSGTSPRDSLRQIILPIAILTLLPRCWLVNFAAVVAIGWMRQMVSAHSETGRGSGMRHRVRAAFRFLDTHCDPLDPPKTGSGCSSALST